MRRRRARTRKFKKTRKMSPRKYSQAIGFRL